MDRPLTENDVMVIKSLNADLRAVSASLAAAEERNRALEAENEQLRKALKAIQMELEELRDLDIPWLDEEQLIYNTTLEALQSKEAE